VRKKKIKRLMAFRPIDCFVHYDGKRADDVAAGRFAVRQLVAQAVSGPGRVRDDNKWNVEIREREMGPEKERKIVSSRRRCGLKQQHERLDDCHLINDDALISLHPIDGRRDCSSTWSCG
jgi:hypothetical protein